MGETDVCIFSEYSGSPVCTRATVTQSTLCTTVLWERSVEASCEYLFWERALRHWSIPSPPPENPVQGTERTHSAMVAVHAAEDVDHGVKPMFFATSLAIVLQPVLYFGHTSRAISSSVTTKAHGIARTSRPKNLHKRPTKNIFACSKVGSANTRFRSNWFCIFQPQASYCSNLHRTNRRHRHAYVDSVFGTQDLCNCPFEERDVRVVFETTVALGIADDCRSTHCVGCSNASFARILRSSFSTLKTMLIKVVVDSSSRLNM